MAEDFAGVQFTPENVDEDVQARSIVEPPADTSIPSHRPLVVTDDFAGEAPDARIFDHELIVLTWGSEDRVWDAALRRGIRWMSVRAIVEDGGPTEVIVFLGVGRESAEAVMERARDFLWSIFLAPPRYLELYDTHIKRPGRWMFWIYRIKTKGRNVGR